MRHIKQLVVGSATAAIAVLFAGVSVVSAGPFVFTQILDSPNHGDGYFRGTFTGDVNSTTIAAGNNSHGALYDKSSGVWTAEWDYSAFPANLDATQADGLNEAGDTVGTVYNSFAPGGGYLTSDSGATSSVVTLGGGISVLADINAAKTILGSSTGGVYLKDSNGVETVLATPFGAADSWGLSSLSDAGDAVGHVELGSIYHGLHRSAGGVYTSFDVPASVSLGTDTNTTATGINASGEIVGQWRDGTNVHSYYAGSLAALLAGTATLMDVPSTWTNFLNSSGTTSPAGSSTAFNTRNPKIANDGSIAGYWTDGRQSNSNGVLGDVHIWQIIPEPGTIALLGLGAMALVLRRKRA